MKPDAQIRGIGLASAIALVVANMIGAGVFTTSGFTLGGLGRRDLVLAAWAVGGVLALFGALSYAALARRLPESGGEYHYLAHTVHPLAGFLAGWVSLLAGFTFPIAVAALALQAYLVPVLEVRFAPEWIGTGAIAVGFVLHGLRRSHGIWVQNIAVALKLALLIGFVTLGSVHLPVVEADPDVPLDIAAFGVGLVYISFCYSGWNAATYIAGEVRDPERNATRALWIGCAMVTVLYVGLNAVFLYAAPVAALSNKPDVGALAAQALGGDWLWRLTSGIVALALLTSISAMMMIGPRVYARMAEDGLFPRRFVLRGDTPKLAVALQSALAITVVWWSGLKELLGYVGFTLSLSAAATVLGLLRLRRREGPSAVPIPGFPWVPGTFVVVTLAATGFLVVEKPGQAGWGLVTVLTGVPFYLWCRRGSDTAAGPATPDAPP